jgi:hypothetical protein
MACIVGFRVAAFLYGTADIGFLIQVASQIAIAIEDRSAYDQVEEARGSYMIKSLAQFFRGFHYVVGISAPPPGTSDRAFVFAWLGAIAIFAVIFVILIFYIIPLLYFRH